MVQTTDPGPARCCAQPAGLQRGTTGRTRRNLLNSLANEHVAAVPFTGPPSLLMFQNMTPRGAVAAAGAEADAPAPAPSATFGNNDVSISGHASCQV